MAFEIVISQTDLVYLAFVFLFFLLAEANLLDELGLVVERFG